MNSMVLELKERYIVEGTRNFHTMLPCEGGAGYVSSFHQKFKQKLICSYIQPEVPCLRNLLAAPHRIELLKWFMLLFKALACTTRQDAVTGEPVP